MIEDYIQAKKKGEKQYRRALAAGRYPYLPALDQIANVTELTQVSLGIMDIPLDMVIGTLTAGRQNAFSAGYMPLLSDTSEFAMKWSKVVDYQAEKGITDEIKVFEFLNRYYVQEGNKRVSVLKYMGAVSVTADVTRILPKKSDDPLIVTYYEYVDFSKASGIYDLVLSESGGYEKLAAVLGENLTDPWPEEKTEQLHEAFSEFSSSYDSQGGRREDITAGDALLVYLDVYPLSSVIEVGRGELTRRIQRIWREILTQRNKKEIALVEDPQKNAKPQGVLSFLFNGQHYSAKNPLLVGFLYEKDPEDSRWAYGHELGRNAVETSFHGVVKTVSYEGCDSPERIEQAFEAAIEDGCGLVFATSPAMIPEALRVAVDHPEVPVLDCSVNMSYNSVITYYSRLYEAKFLMGLLAGVLSRGDRIGYTADYPIYGSIADINAFAIGAGMVRPQAKIVLKWQCIPGTDWLEEFKREGISIVSGPDLILPSSPVREYGLYRFTEDGLQNVAAPVRDWGVYYRRIIQTVLDGTWKTQERPEDTAINYWWGMSSGVVDVILSGKLPSSVTRLLDHFREQIIGGVFQPFDGELVSQKGRVRSVLDPLLTNKEIITMNWLNENVEGLIPTPEMLSRDTYEKIRAMGVVPKEK